MNVTTQTPERRLNGLNRPQPFEISIASAPLYKKQEIEIQPSDTMSVAVLPEPGLHEQHLPAKKAGRGVKVSMKVAIITAVIIISTLILISVLLLHSG